MSADSFRDSEGFGRPVQVEPAVYSVTGPDGMGHAQLCRFIASKGILPCSCDATRRAIHDRPDLVSHSWWYRCWFRWQEVRCSALLRPAPLPWPVHGPDGDPWVPGIDFHDGRDEDDI